MNYVNVKFNPFALKVSGTEAQCVSKELVT